MKIYNLNKLVSAPISYVKGNFKVLSDKSVLMKCRNKQNWHKYCGSLEPELGNSLVESKSLNQNHKESGVPHHFMSDVTVVKSCVQ